MKQWPTRRSVVGLIWRPIACFACCCSSLLGYDRYFRIEQKGGVSVLLETANTELNKRTNQTPPPTPIPPWWLHCIHRFLEYTGLSRMQKEQAEWTLHEWKWMVNQWGSWRIYEYVHCISTVHGSDSSWIPTIIPVSCMFFNVCWLSLDSRQVQQRPERACSTAPALIWPEFWPNSPHQIKEILQSCGAVYNSNPRIV
jgi:hypothetical protein